MLMKKGGGGIFRGLTMIVDQSKWLPTEKKKKKKAAQRERIGRKS